MNNVANAMRIMLLFGVAMSAILSRIIAAKLAGGKRWALALGALAPVRQS